MNLLVSLLAGIVFGIGLTVAGMTNPQKVLNFLDIAAIRTGTWDPTLLAVFAGALPVMFLFYRLRDRTTKPAFGSDYSQTVTDVVDRPVVIGSTLFGIGWGLAGLCPGPAVVALGLASRSALGPALLFFGAMLCGVWLAYVTRLTGSARGSAAV